MRDEAVEIVRPVLYCIVFNFETNLAPIDATLGVHIIKVGAHRVIYFVIAR
jgi:hypothetical protein